MAVTACAGDREHFLFAAVELPDGASVLACWGAYRHTRDAVTGVLGWQRHDAWSVLAHLREAGIPPNRFGVEVTETVFLDHNVEHAQKTLRALSEGGVWIALDDFHRIRSRATSQVEETRKGREIDPACQGIPEAA